MAATISVNAIQVNRGNVATGATGNPYVVVVQDIINLQTFVGGYLTERPDTRINSLIELRGFGQNAGTTVQCENTISELLSLIAATNPALPAMTIIAQPYAATTPITISAYRTQVTSTLTGVTNVSLTTGATVLAGSIVTFIWTATGASRVVTYSTGFTTSGRTATITTTNTRCETFVYNGTTWDLISTVTNAIV